jgi:hypothetical protein
MSKKKQLSGKTTKLAKLPLTEALSRQMEEAVPEPPEPALQAESAQTAFSWESLEEGAAGLLAAAYALVVQDLLTLNREIPWTSAEAFPEAATHPAAKLPPHQVRQALRQTKADLTDLSRFLSS